MNKDPASEGKDKIFDRILKENAYDLFIPLIEKELGIKIKSYEPLNVELPRTLGRRIDFLCLVVTEESERFILHVEFQTKDDKKMLSRIGEYHGILFRKHQLPIRHVVVFLGIGKAKMQTQLDTNEIFTGFDLINLNELDADNLLSSQVPEVVLLALLGDYEEERTEVVLRLIVRKLKSVASSESALKKYVEQLILLSKLRKLEDVTTKIVSNMPITYDIEQDYFYKAGRATEREIANQEIEQEREKAKQEREKAKQEKIDSIKSLLSMGSLSTSQIAEIMNVSENFVKDISEEKQ